MSVIVETNFGPVRGEQRKFAATGESFISFRGIPYAKPPVGPLRFKDPVEPEPWTQPWDATQPGKSAVSMEELMPTPGKEMKVMADCSEDCLFVNVYTKELNPRKPLPVMVWIHGGGFKVGSSSEQIYGPDYLLQKSIVFVSFNYRLGALGFLSLANPSVKVPGNAALKDQTLALKWVRANVHRFGGDAANITLFGESAGASSVHFHMISPHSSGLFDKAIIQSGSAVAEWANFPQNNWAARLARALGWQPAAVSSDANASATTDDDESVLVFLQNADANDIVRMQDSIRSMDEIKLGITTFGPTAEPYVAEQSFFTVNPVELAKTAWSNGRVPLIIGGVVDEGLLFYKIVEPLAELFQCSGPEAFQTFIPLCVLNSGIDHVGLLEIAKRIRDFYYVDEEPNVQNFVKTLQIWGDKGFWHSFVHSANLRVEQPQSAPTYFYRFAVDSKVLFHLKHLIVGKYVKGVCHGDDLLYLFKPTFVKELMINSIEERTVQRMVDMWTQFATTGNPNGGEVKGPKWEPLKSGEPIRCLNIDEELSFIELPEMKRIQFWNSIYKS